MEWAERTQRDGGLGGTQRDKKGAVGRRLHNLTICIWNKCCGVWGTRRPEDQNIESSPFKNESLVFPQKHQWHKSANSHSMLLGHITLLRVALSKNSQHRGAALLCACYNKYWNLIQTRKAKVIDPCLESTSTKKPMFCGCHCNHAGIRHSHPKYNNFIIGLNTQDVRRHKKV